MVEQYSDTGFVAEVREYSKEGLAFHHKRATDLGEISAAYEDMLSSIISTEAISIEAVDVKMRDDDEGICYQVVTRLEDGTVSRSQIFGLEIINQALDMLVGRNGDREEIDDRLVNLEPVDGPITIPYKQRESNLTES